MKTFNLIAGILVIGIATTIAIGQGTGSDLVVLKCSWEKERIRPRPSLAPLASQDELIEQSRREQQLATARNSGKTAAGKIETQSKNHQQAVAQAQQTELPRDGYRYKMKVRNEGVRTVQSIDWDYLFIDPNTNEVVMRHQFTSDETIKSGSTKEVSVLYLVPPVKTISVSALTRSESNSYLQQALVTRLTFTDGTTWQAPSNR